MMIQYWVLKKQSNVNLFTINFIKKQLLATFLDLHTYESKFENWFLEGVIYCYNNKDVIKELNPEMSILKEMNWFKITLNNKKIAIINWINEY
jgi:hypothetical protein